MAIKRNDSGGGDREVQRILMELLTQMDGFDQTTNVKVIMATNRPEMLDPALMRPGRLDRKVEFPLPDRRQKRLVCQACTAKMNLSDEVDLESFVNRPQKISCADIASICQEAGLQAIRRNRYVILTKDLEKAYKKVVKRADSEYDFYSWGVCSKQATENRTGPCPPFRCSPTSRRRARLAAAAAARCPRSRCSSSSASPARDTAGTRALAPTRWRSPSAGRPAVGGSWRRPC